MSYRFFLLISCLVPHAASLSQVSPELLKDGRVTFRCKAGNAKTVQANGQFGEPVKLTKSEDGVWSGTTAKPVQPGVYEYRLKIDNRDTIDSRNSAIKPQRWPNTSILHIPSDPPAPWDLQAIPHGTLHRHTYHSKALNCWRELVVYTPPGDAHVDIPVLYLAHGRSDNQRTWTEHGKAHHILDSLIHEGKAEPMIIVMSDAHAIDPGPKRVDSYAPNNTSAFCKELLMDVIPYVEARYPASKTPENRAFAGLSMGGGHALTIALRHSTHFSQVGAFSAAPPKTELPDSDTIKAINEQLSLLWIACGDKDFLFQRNQAFHKELQKRQLHAEYLVTPGDGHSWLVWRSYLTEFAPRLFK